MDNWKVSMFFLILLFFQLQQVQITTCKQLLYVAHCTLKYIMHTAGSLANCLLHVCKCKCKCIRNWPLPIRAFQNQCKQIVINKHSLAKNPNWREADQLAIYKCSLEVELGATENNISSLL